MVGRGWGDERQRRGVARHHGEPGLRSAIQDEADRDVRGVSEAVLLVERSERRDVRAAGDGAIIRRHARENDRKHREAGVAGGVAAGDREVGETRAVAGPPGDERGDGDVEGVVAHRGRGGRRIAERKVVRVARRERRAVAGGGDRDRVCAAAKQRPAGDVLNAECHRLDVVGDVDRGGIEPRLHRH